MIKESNVAENIFLISELIALYALQQGDEIEIQEKHIKDVESCRVWQFDYQQNILSTCHSRANCTFFFFTVQCNYWK